jgi:putative transposase
MPASGSSTKTADYEAFVRLFDQAHERCPMRLLAWCLMPNHFHLVLWPREDGDISRWMQWLLTTHVRRYHEQHRTTGHVWQGRFKAFPIQQDEHLLTVLRYVERNPLRAGLVAGVGDWPWCSLRLNEQPDRPAWYSAGPVRRGADWPAYVAQPQTDAELVAAAERGAGRAVRQPALAEEDGRCLGPGEHPPPPRPSEEAYK